MFSAHKEFFFPLVISVNKSPRLADYQKIPDIWHKPAQDTNIA